MKIMMSKDAAAHRRTERRANHDASGLAASGAGQAMVLICVSLIAVMGMIAVATDFSYLQAQRNMMQTAADSAAMAGAEELNYGDTVTAAKADAASNGYTDGQGGVTVAINNPPSMGPNTSNSGYVEAIVSKPEPTYFLRVLGVSSISVSARAVASMGNGSNCIYVLNPSVSGAMTNSGGVTVNSSSGLLVDSTSAIALSVNGSVTLTAPTIGVVGGYTSTGGASITPTPKTGVIAASDPLSYVPAPAVGACGHTNFKLSGSNGSSGSPYQLYSGTYCGGITVNGNAVLNFNGGTYVLAGGGMSIGSNTVMTGTGVTFYNTSGMGGYGPISIGSGATVNFSAPTSGSLAGILFFQDRSIPTTAAGSTIAGNSHSTFDGAVYFPTTPLSFTGNSSTNGYGILVANTLVLNGNASLGNNYSSLANGSPIKGSALAE